MLRNIRKSSCGKHYLYDLYCFALCPSSILTKEDLKRHIESLYTELQKSGNILEEMITQERAEDLRRGK